jgi:hypothetical protein
MTRSVGAVLIDPANRAAPGPLDQFAHASADEAIVAHQRVAEEIWRESLKGPAGAVRLRQLLAAARG